MTREMKDSGIEWIGAIPSSWDTIKIKYTSWLKGRIGWQGLTATEYVDDGPYLITGTDFQGGKVDWSTCAHITEERFEEDSDIHIKEGDLLITKDGTVGKVAIARNCPEKVSLNSGVLLIRNTRNYKYHDKYLYYVLLSDEFWRWYTLSQTGQSTIKHLYQAQFYDFEFTYPSLDEQRKIAAKLDLECNSIDALIEKTRKSIEEYKKMKQAVISEAVTRGIRPNRPMKKSGNGWVREMPADWIVNKLKYLVDFVQTKYSKTDGDLNYIGLENIAGWNGKYIETDSTCDLDQALVCEAGDILFGKLRPYLAKVHISKAKQCCSGEFAVIRINQCYRPKFLWYQLVSNGFISLVDQSTYGTKMPRASISFIKEIEMPIPLIDEQIEIEEYLDSRTETINNLVERKELLIKDLESYKKTLIFEYVTGKKRLIDGEV